MDVVRLCKFAGNHYNYYERIGLIFLNKDHYCIAVMFLSLVDMHMDLNLVGLDFFGPGMVNMMCIPDYLDHKNR